MKQTKLFERLVTKFSIKVNDLAKYLEISKATIYNYRNLDEFSQMPNDKQYKIFYLFGKESVDELLLLLDENDKNALKNYSDRIDTILNERNAVVRLGVVPARQSIFEGIEKLQNIDDLSKKAVLDKVSAVLSKLNDMEIKSFVDFLEIYNTHIDSRRK